MLRWLDARLIGDDETFPIYRSTDGTEIIAKDRGNMQLVFSSLIQNGPPVHVSQRERFRVSAFKTPEEGCCADCRRVTYWLDLQFLDPRNGEWFPLLMMPEMKLSVVLEALQDMGRFLDPPDWAKRGDFSVGVVRPKGKQ